MVGWECIHIPHPPLKSLPCSSLLAIASMLDEGLCKSSCIEVPTHEGFSVSLTISCIEVAGRNST